MERDKSYRLMCKIIKFFEKLRKFSLEMNEWLYQQVSVDGMNKCLSNLDSRADKQRFLEANHAAFMIPKKFDSANYQHKIDEVIVQLNKS